MKMLSRLSLLMLVIALTGCTYWRRKAAEANSNTQPALSRVSSTECLNAANGPITIWHEGPDNDPVFDCTTKVIVSLYDNSIGYDGQIKSLDDVYSLVNGAGHVFTNVELHNGDWPDTIGHTEEEPQ